MKGFIVPRPPLSTGRKEEVTTAAFFSAMNASWDSRRPGYQTSSESRKATYLPFASRNPMFRAPDDPLFTGEAISLTRPSFSA